MRYTAMAILLAAAFGGCDTAPKGDAAHAVVDVNTAQGYALMYDLVSRQKDVSKILILKSVSDDTKAIIGEIAAAAGDLSDKLEAWAKADGLSLKREATGLPRFEVDTRDAIQSRTTKYLLFGGDFEVRLIFTQMNACEYGVEMARNLADRDIPADRRDELTRFAKAYDDIFNRLVGRLATK